MEDALQTPWVESPSFPELLKSRNLSPRQVEQVTAFRRDGYLLIEDAVITDDEIEQINKDTQSLIDQQFALLDVIVRDPDATQGELVEAAKRELLENIGRQFKLSSEQIEEALKSDSEKLKRDAFVMFNKQLDAWRHSETIMRLACHPKVLSLLELLYGRKPIPFQTLNFVSGTEQRLHADSFPFSSIPGRFMCGVWFALEDLNANNGPLQYVPGSHNFPLCDYEDLGIDTSKSYEECYGRYEEAIGRMVENSGLPVKSLRLKKGQAIIWASNLLHGGMEILDKSLTRKSQVTHYYFENCIYYTPLASIPKFGEYCLRDISDIRTGDRVEHSLNGRAVKVTPIPNTGRSRLSFA